MLKGHGKVSAAPNICCRLWGGGGGGGEEQKNKKKRVLEKVSFVVGHLGRKWATAGLGRRCLQAHSRRFVIRRLTPARRGAYGATSQKPSLQERDFYHTLSFVFLWGRVPEDAGGQRCDRPHPPHTAACNCDGCRLDLNFLLDPVFFLPPPLTRKRRSHDIIDVLRPFTRGICVLSRKRLIGSALRASVQIQLIQLAGCVPRITAWWWQLHGN